MWPLPVSDLFFVGRATTKKLLALGITTIGELAQADPVWLRKILKKQGEIVWAFANGMDESPVLNEAPANKGYGNSTTTPFDVRDYDTAKKVLLGLSETVGSRLRADHVEIEVVTVGIRYSDLSYISHQKKLLNSTNLTIKIYETACGLFQELWNGEQIRHLGVHTGKVLDGDIFRQLDLFDETDYDKLAKADATLDEIRERFGIDAVKRAVFVDSPIDHIVADAYLNGILPEYEVVGVLGRTKEKAEALAEKLGCERCENIDELMALSPDYVQKRHEWQYLLFVRWQPSLL